MNPFKPILADVFAQVVQPLLLASGFVARRSLTWRRGDRLEVRAVVDSKATDRYRGGAFTIEFETSDDGRFAHKLSGRTRIDQLIDDDQRRRFLAVRNSIAERLQKPDPSYLADWADELRAEYLRPFLRAEVSERQFWMRYRNVEDLHESCSLIVEVLPDLIRRAESIDPHELVLGQDLKW